MDSLPSELVVKIWQELPVVDRVRFGLTSPRVHKITEDAINWKQFEKVFRFTVATISPFLTSNNFLGMRLLPNKWSLDGCNTCKCVGLYDRMRSMNICSTCYNFSIVTVKDNKDRLVGAWKFLFGKISPKSIILDSPASILLAHVPNKYMFRNVESISVEYLPSAHKSSLYVISENIHTLLSLDVKVSTAWQDEIGDIFTVTMLQLVARCSRITELKLFLSLGTYCFLPYRNFIPKTLSSLASTLTSLFLFVDRCSRIFKKEGADFLERGTYDRVLGALPNLIEFCLDCDFPLPVSWIVDMPCHKNLKRMCGFYGDFRGHHFREFRNSVPNLEFLGVRNKPSFYDDDNCVDIFRSMELIHTHEKPLNMFIMRGIQHFDVLAKTCHHCEVEVEVGSDRVYRFNNARLYVNLLPKEVCFCARDGFHPYSKNECRGYENTCF